MKTVEQVMKGVSDGGKWKLFATMDGFASIRSGGKRVKWSEEDLAYAARAVSTWPELVRALEDAIKAIENCERHVKLLGGERARNVEARAALEQALREEI